MPSTPQLSALARELEALEAEIRNDAAATLARWAPRLSRGDFAAPAENLALYLALRRRDRTALQKRLRLVGLSSLGRSEGRVLETLRAVRATVEGRDPEGSDDHAAHRLAAAAEALFGPRPPARRTRIMTTLSPETALDPARIAAIIAAGADIVRINCAHDAPETWRAMAVAARTAAQEAGRSLRVYVDLAGPKIRTGDIAPKPGLRVREGDALYLRLTPGAAAPDGMRAAFDCSLPEAAAQAAEGGAVAIDDGKILGRVLSRDASGLRLRVERTKPGGARLKPDKGLNFPGADIAVDPLTQADRAALDAIGGAADMLGYSFVQRAGDIDVLRAEMAARGVSAGIIAKIETAQAFRNLPEIIVAGAGAGPFGVMIARGDLGVEVGFPRLSEVQEEILLLCEAAQIPVVWATEVLSNLVKHGVAARGEFTDAAMGARAECVMLNKGPFLDEGVAVLDDVLRRAERHLDKKVPQLPALHAWTPAVS